MNAIQALLLLCTFDGTCAVTHLSDTEVFVQYRAKPTVMSELSNQVIIRDGTRYHITFGEAVEL